MELQATVESLCGFAGRSAGSDAERRAADWLRDRAGAGKREAELEVHWVRPHWSTIHLVHALAGVVGSLVSTASATAGVALVAVAFLSTLLELGGRPSVGRLLSFRRATQNVVAPPPRARSRRVRVVVVAAYDAAQRGLVFRPTFRRWDAAMRAATRGWWPPALLWMALALALLTTTTAVRAAGYDPSWLSVVQLVPTVALLVAIALLADVSLSDPSPDASGASAVAVALNLVQALDEQPLARLDVELVLAGAGDGPALGAGAYVRKRRRRWDAARLAFLEIRPCSGGRPAFWATDGPLVPLRLHPRLIELVRGADPAAPGQRGRDASAAYRARQARWPAVAVGALDERGIVPHRRAADDEPQTVDAKSMEATLELCVAVITALDEDLARREQSDGAEAMQGAGREHSEREKEATQDAGREHSDRAERKQSDRTEATPGAEHEQSDSADAPRAAEREQSDRTEAPRAAEREQSDRAEAPQDAERKQSDHAQATHGAEHDRTEEDPTP
jgi:hypothetical protein